MTSTEQPPFRYDAAMASEIELRWQARWEAQGTFYAPNPTGPLSGGFAHAAGQPTCYVLDFFPYPSGTGLQVGNLLGYIATDAFARFLRMTGHTVLHPVGYDAFGLPAEQFAVSTGQHPAITTRTNIARMRGQLRRLGAGYDTRREISTTDPRFYRWTQWIFLRIFNSWFDEDSGRARPIAELVAEFEAGTRKASGGANPRGIPWSDLDEVTRRRVVDSWRLAYLSEELVNWSPDLGTVLANEEITAEGRSDVGNYPVYRRPLRQWVLRITAYAERLLDDLDQLDWPEPVKLLQRNWIGASDGAIIAFPVRDRVTIDAFTTRPDTLPGATYLVLAPEHPLAGALAAGRWPPGTPASWRGPGGGDGRSPADAVRAYQERAAQAGDRQRAASAGKSGVFTGAYASNPATGEQVPVFIADYVLMGYGTGAIMGVPAQDERDRQFARRFGLPVVRLPAAGDIDAAMAQLEKSGWGRRQRTYRLRDWVFSRQRYWGEPFPIVYDRLGLPVALPDDMLPVTLPEMSQFAPQPAQGGDPVPPLARAAGWAEVELDLGDGRQVYRRELNTMPQWAASCWYYLRFLDPGNDDAFVGPENERYWMVPDDAPPGDGGVGLYVGGVEHAVLHLLYARFWHKVLFDLGYLSTREPFSRLVNQGYITADAFTDSRGLYVPAAEVERPGDGTFRWHGAPVTLRAGGKMGRSRKNSVPPDEVYARYGADTLRLYEMAMGPLEADRPWHTDDIAGVYRFLQRLWRSIVDERTGDLIVVDAAVDADISRLLHQTIHAVRGHYAGLRFNLAIARLQELTRRAARVAAERGQLPRAVAEPLVLMVSPLAPHIAEELWARLGHRESVVGVAYPVSDPALATEPTVTLPVQINGKTRLRIEVPAGAGEEEIASLVTGHPDLARLLGGGAVDRLIVVPGRIANVVTR